MIKLNSGAISTLIRLFSVISLLLILAGGLLLSAPVNNGATKITVATALAPTRSEAPIVFAGFDSLRGNRASSLFEFVEITRSDVQWQHPQVAVPPGMVQEQPMATPKPDPIDAPDVDGLVLIGTAPGSGRAFALIRDEQKGQTEPITTTYTRGETLRNAVISEVFVDRIVLTIGSQQTELQLSSIGQVANGAPRPVQREQPIQVKTSAMVPPTQTQPVVNSAKPVQPINAATPASFGLKGYIVKGASLKDYDLKETALMVTGVQQHDSTVQSGDLILYIDNQKISSLTDLQSIIKSKSSGDTVSVRLKREQKTLTVDFNLS